MPTGKADFPKKIRLLKATDYRRVFQKPRKSADALFTVLWRQNDQGVARLGLAVSKKSASRAVDRNRIKRLIRESFRLSHNRLPSVDLIVLSRAGVALRTNQNILDSLERHWKKIVLNG